MKVLSFINRYLEEVICCTLLSAMSVIIFLQVVFRVFNFPLAWTEEIGRYLFVWIIYIGCATAVKKRKHISVDILDLVLKERGRFWLNIFSTVVILAFSLILFYNSFEMVARVTEQVTPTTRISMAIPYSSILVGSGLMTLRAIQDIYLRFKERKEEVANHVD